MRVLWKIAGYGFFALGVVGAALPLIPTVGPWLLAVVCLVKGKDPLAQKLLDHPRVGRHLRAWFDTGAIARRGKIAASLAMAVSVAVAFVVNTNGVLVTALAVVLAALSLWLWTRPEPALEP